MREDVWDQKESLGKSVEEFERLKAEGMGVERSARLGGGRASWFRTTKNWDVGAGSLVCLLVCLLAPLTPLLCTDRISFVYLLDRSLIPELVRK